MRFTTYQPNWTPIRQFQRELDRVWDHYQDLRDDREEGTTWTPTVDTQETATQWLLIAEVPGVDPDNIDITTENGYLIIKGEKKALDASDDTVEKHRQERVIGRFYRRFTLPKQADTQEISAQSKNGLLLVVIPKQAEVQPKRIKITSA